MRNERATSRTDGTMLARWPQYRKASSPLGALAILSRIAVGAVVVLALAVSLRPDPDDQKTAMTPLARHVTLEKVTIVGKRERVDMPVVSDAVRATSTHQAQFPVRPGHDKVAVRRD